MANEIGNRIKKARESRSITQAQLAEAAKLDIRTIRRIENGENPPSAESLQGICLVLGLDAQEVKRESSATLRPKAKAEVAFVSDGHALLQNLVGFHDGAVDADDAGDDEETASLVKELIQSLEFAEVMPELPADAIYEQGRVLTKAIKALEAKRWVVAVVKKFDITIEWGGKSIPNWNRVILMVKDAERLGGRALSAPTAGRQ
jgi:transcriptional regulator with XRE-family HTH domain